MTTTYPHRRDASSTNSRSICVCGDVTLYGYTPDEWGADCPAALREALSAAEKERDELRATLARLQSPASDLPPVGTRWGDIPDEVRARLPVGTRLGSAGTRGGLPLRLGSELGYYLEDYGLGPILRSAIHPDRRILSYPPTESA